MIFFHCTCIDCSRYFIIVRAPQYLPLAMTDSNDVTLTFLSLLESFLVALMKSLRPWRYSSYSSRVMSPFSTRTCGRWGSEETHSEPSLTPLEIQSRWTLPETETQWLYVVGFSCSLPVSAWQLRAANVASRRCAGAQRDKATSLAVNYLVQVNSEHFSFHLDKQFNNKWIKLRFFLNYLSPFTLKVQISFYVQFQHIKAKTQQCINYVPLLPLNSFIHWLFAGGYRGFLLLRKRPVVT